MNEQTKIELLKIASNLTIAHADKNGKSENDVKRYFEHFCFYLFENFEKLGTEKEIAINSQDSI